MKRIKKMQIEPSIDLSIEKSNGSVAPEVRCRWLFEFQPQMRD